MPILEFQFDDTGEIVEEIYMPWEDLPREIERDGRTARRIISVPARAGVPDPELARLARRGVVPYESGMNRDAQRAKQDKERQAARKRRRVAEESVTDALTTTLHI